MVTLFITLVTKSHDPLSKLLQEVGVELLAQDEEAVGTCRKANPSFRL